MRLFSDIASDVDLTAPNGVNLIPLAGNMLDYPDVIGVSVGTDGSQYVVSGDHFDTKTLVYDNKICDPFIVFDSFHNVCYTHNRDNTVCATKASFFDEIPNDVSVIKDEYVMHRRVHELVTCISRDFDSTRAIFINAHDTFIGAKPLDCVCEQLLCGAIKKAARESITDKIKAGLFDVMDADYEYNALSTYQNTVSLLPLDVMEHLGFFDTPEDAKDSIFAVDMRDVLIWLSCNEGNFDSEFDSMFSSDVATINIVDGDSQLAKLLIDGSIPISSDRAYICNDNLDYEYMSDYDRCVHALEFMFPYQDHGEDIVSYFDMENDGELIEHNDGLEFAF